MFEQDVTRRRFVVGSGAALGAGFLLPRSVLAATRVSPSGLSNGAFPTGLLSGDPTTSSITLLTRVADVTGSGGVGVEVSTSSTFEASKVVKSTTLPLTATNDFTVKTAVTGLKPHTQYYYRFFTKNNSSRVGRFRTALPSSSKQEVKFAFFSCQDYTFGYYNAHHLMAADDLDFVVNLGDYIYAEAYHSPTGTDYTGVRGDVIGSDLGNGYVTASTLEQYRAKYELYRSDADLQDMHASHAMFSIWDDHEIIDNYAGAPSDGGLPSSHAFNRARQAAAYRAWFEKMPNNRSTSASASDPNRIYKKLSYGKSLDLFLLDQRQYRDDQPHGDPALANPSTWDDYKGVRKFLGTAQMAWLKSELKNSKATWKAIGNEVMVMNTKFTSSSYFNFDSWQGYPAEREDLLNYIGGTHLANKSPIKGVVFVTGDIHTFAAGDVIRDPESVKGSEADKAVATEFVGGSISSQGLGDGGIGGPLGWSRDKILEACRALQPKTDPTTIALLAGANRWLANVDFDHHGYGRATASPSSFKCDLVRVSTIKSKTETNGNRVGALPLIEPGTDRNGYSNGLWPRFTWTVKPGSPSIRDIRR